MIVKLQLTVRRINQNPEGGFIEFKVESDQTGEHGTGHIIQNGTFSFDWPVGDTLQDVWFWWDTLDGDASVLLRVNDEVVFDGDCTHAGIREVRVIDSTINQRIYKTSGSPYLVERPDRPVTIIKW